MPAHVPPGTAGDPAPTSAIVIVGNEILSGATRDANAWFLARHLAGLGHRVTGVSVIPDDEERIATTVASLAAEVDHVFVCGGIGPTHDDVTRPAVARGLGRRCVVHPEAENVLREFYGDRINEQRLSMAQLPEGCMLVPNPVSAAPGFVVDGVVVLPGIPSLVERMFPTVVPLLATVPTHEIIVRSGLGEGDFAAGLATVQRRHPALSIGSYPATTAADYRRQKARIVIRGRDEPQVTAAAGEIRALLDELSPGSALT